MVSLRRTSRLSICGANGAEASLSLNWERFFKIFWMFSWTWKNEKKLINNFNNWLFNGLIKWIDYSLWSQKTFEYSHQWFCLIVQNCSTKKVFFAQWTPFIKKWTTCRIQKMLRPQSWNTEQGKCRLTKEYPFFLFLIGHWNYEKKCFVFIKTTYSNRYSFVACNSRYA